MDRKKLSSTEVFVMILGLLVFISLSLVVIFKSEWLDSIFYGSVSDSPILIDYDSESIEYPLVFLDIVSDGEGRGQLFFNLNMPSRITGVELSLEKDDTLEIAEFVCNQPFECLFFESTSNEVSLVAIIPVGLIDFFEPGEIFVGDFEYSGSGSLYLTPEGASFVSDLEYSEYNILDLYGKKFTF